MITFQSKIPKLSTSLPTLSGSSNLKEPPSFKSKIIKTSELNMNHKFKLSQFLKDYKNYQKYKVIRKLFKNAKTFEEHNLIQSEYDEIDGKIKHFEAYYSPVLIFIEDNKLDVNNPANMARLSGMFEGATLKTKTFTEMMNDKGDA